MTATKTQKRSCSPQGHNASAAAHRHRGFGGRRQEHPDRAAAARHRQPAAGPPGSRHRRRGRRRPRSAVRRSARRTRTGHHDRRRVPLLLHRNPQLHPGRHPRPRALHPQHVHRRLQRARGHPAGRRARRGAAADPQARPHRKAVGHQALCRNREQDRPDRLRPGRVRRGGRRAAAVGGAPWRGGHHGDPDRGQARRQRRAPLRPHAVVQRPHAAGVPGRRRTGRATGRAVAAAAAGAVGVAADRRRAPPLHRAPRGGNAQRRRSGGIAALPAPARR